MNEYSFTLQIDGPLTEERVRALYESGCSDMTFQGDETGPGSADVHREAPNFVDAILSAVSDIEHVRGLTVHGVENQELVRQATLWLPFARGATPTGPALALVRSCGMGERASRHALRSPRDRPHRSHQ